MKIPVIKTDPTPASERGAREIRDFRLHSGYSIVVTKSKIQNSLEEQTPFNPSVCDRLRETSPRHNV